MTFYNLSFNRVKTVWTKRKTLRRVDGRCRYVAKMQSRLHWKTANNCDCGTQKRIILLSSYLTNSDQGLLTSLRKNYIAFLSIHSLDRIKRNLYKESRIKRYTKLISASEDSLIKLERFFAC